MTVTAMHEPHHRQIDPAARRAPRPARTPDRRRRASSAGAAATTAATASAPPAAMISASCSSMPAVAPRRKLSSPACRPRDMVWMTVSSTIPKPKKTDSTAPIAASSASRVRAGDPVHEQQPQPRRDRRSDHQAEEVAPVAAEGHHDDEGNADSRQRGMGDRIADQRALAQEEKGPVHSPPQSRAAPRRRRRGRRCSRP